MVDKQENGVAHQLDTALEKIELLEAEVKRLTAAMETAIAANEAAMEAMRLEAQRAVNAALQLAETSEKQREYQARLAAACWAALKVSQDGPTEQAAAVIKEFDRINTEVDLLRKRADLEQKAAEVAALEERMKAV